MKKHRWPKSPHSQVEAVLHGIRAIRQKKSAEADMIRSFGTMSVYRKEIHKFIEAFMSFPGGSNILDTEVVAQGMDFYLESKLRNYLLNKRSVQTYKTTLSAMGKFEYALNRYIHTHCLDSNPLNIKDMRHRYYRLSKKILSQTSRSFSNRAYPEPVRLIEAIDDLVFQLQACLQYEGGLRAEGVGAPTNGISNPLKLSALAGIVIDPITKKNVGSVVVKEKGGKETSHYVSVETYQRLEKHLQAHGTLASVYPDYLNAINVAAQKTGQHEKGRGSHGLKYNFAQERYLECVMNGQTHEQAMQSVSLETAHFRLNETLTYTRGRS